MPNTEVKLKTEIMKEIKCELKNVKFHQGHEGYGVNADLWINNVKCVHVLDDGNGGCLHIDVLGYGAKPQVITDIKTNVQHLKDYIDSLPEKPLGFNFKDKQGNIRMHKTTLEDYIIDLFT